MKRPDARMRAWLLRFRRLMNARRYAMLLGAGLAAYGLGGAGYIEAKATLAQHLLDRAYERSLETGVAAKPWPWADTHPVARLAVERLGVEQIVLAGASGRTLAFGPAWSDGAALPGTRGLAVVSGHRDTHFAFLRELAVGDVLSIETRGGRARYRVERFDVVDSRTTRLATGGDAARLALVTCWPFDTLTVGGPMRYVATASLIAEDRS